MKGGNSHRETLVIAGTLLAGALTVGASAYAHSRPLWLEQGVLDFERVDTNADGSISFQEFTVQSGDRWAFRAADLNHDGRLDRKEHFAARSLVQRTSLDTYLDDAWITAKVKALLLHDGILSGLQIHVKTRHGVVQLSGSVERPEQIGRAILLASGVEGVKQVQNDLALEDALSPPAARENGHALGQQGRSHVASRRLTASPGTPRRVRRDLNLKPATS
jgi:hyperosmotically inducible protein